MSDSRGDSGQVLTFRVGAEEYGVDILRVQEIRRWQKPTLIPHTPHYVKGILNLRGVLVPVVDMRARIGSSEAACTPTTVMIVARAQAADQDRVVAMVVDMVSDVGTIPASDLKPAPDCGSLDRELIQGLGSIGERMIIVLDLDRLLDPSAFEQVAETAESAA